MAFAEDLERSFINSGYEAHCITVSSALIASLVHYYTVDN